MDIVLSKIQEYVKSLEWQYMITFLILSYISTKDKALTLWWKESDKNKVFNFVRNILLKTPKGIRVLIIGLVYAIVYYKVYTLDKKHIPVMFESFIFVTAFYGLIIKKVIKTLEKWVGIKTKEQEIIKNVEKGPIR